MVKRKQECYVDKVWLWMSDCFLKHAHLMLYCHEIVMHLLELQSSNGTHISGHPYMSKFLYPLVNVTTCNISIRDLL